MKNMITSYKESCLKARKRIHELTELRTALRRQGKESRINELALDRRIKLLYDENLQMMEIIASLDSYVRRMENRGET